MDFKAKLYDRKRPDVAIAEINKVLSELLSNNVTINKREKKIIVTAQSLDKNYYDFKELVEAILTVIIGTLETNDFAQSYHTQLDTDVSALGYIKESDLDTAVSALGYIKKSELESWLTEHGYQPQQ